MIGMSHDEDKVRIKELERELADERKRQDDRDRMYDMHVLVAPERHDFLLECERLVAARPSLATQKAILDPSVYDETDQHRDDHPCAIECQRREHKVYPRCVAANQCDYNGGQMAESPESVFENICDELKVQMAPHLYEAVRVFAERLSTKP